MDTLLSPATFLTMDSNTYVFTIQTDQSDERYLICALGSSLVRFPKDNTNNIVTILVGNVTKHGYKEGQGREAVFRFIQGMGQRENGIVLSDTNNHCIRYVTTRYQTRLLAGTCEEPGYVCDECSFKDSKFYYPRGLVVDNNDSDLVYVAQNDLRLMNLRTKRVTALLEYRRNGPLNHLVIDPTTGDFIMTAADSRLVIINKGDWQQSTNITNFAEVELGKFCRTPQGVQVWGKEEILIACGNSVRVFPRDNLTDSTGFSICNENSSGYNDGGITECELTGARALLVDDDKIYIGEHSVAGGGVRRLRILPEITTSTTDESVTIKILTRKHEQTVHQIHINETEAPELINPEITTGSYESPPEIDGNKTINVSSSKAPTNRNSVSLRNASDSVETSGVNDSVISGGNRAVSHLHIGR